MDNERAKRMFQDGQSIGEIALLETRELVKENELYLKNFNINPDEHLIICSIGMSKLMFTAMNLGVAIKLIPELLRIVANAIEIISQNAHREKRDV